MRNILLHQIGDADADRAAGLRTWVVDLGLGRSERFVRLLVPVELALFALYAWLVTRSLPMFPVGILFAWLYLAWRERRHHGRPVPAGFRAFLFVYIDDLYVEWIPLLVLLAGAITQPVFLPLLALHVFVFPKNAIRRVLADAGWLPSGGAD